MSLTIDTKAVPIKPKNRIWSLADGSLNEVVPYDQFFFQWKDGCFLGTYYNTKRGGGFEPEDLSNPATNKSLTHLPHERVRF